MDDAVRIAFTSGLPFRGLRDRTPDAALLAGFPAGWLAERTVLPLAFDDNTLTLASAAPDPDLMGLDPSLTIMVVISPAAEIAALLGAPAPAAPPAPVVERPPVAEPPAPVAPPPPPPPPPPRPAPPAPLAPPDPAALRALPEHLQRRHRVLPVALDEQSVHVVYADPLDDAAIAELRAAVAPRALRAREADGERIDERLLAAHGERWAAAIRDGLPRHPRPAAPARPDDAAPPRTTLLIPLVGGVGAAVQAATTLAALDHPAPRLEVLLLVGADDDAVARAARTSGHRVLVAPPSLPDAPTALLDLGLLLARGEHVAVLAPGDIPAPRLLGHADAALAVAGVAAARPLPREPEASAPPPARRRLAARLRPDVAAPTSLPASGVVARRDVLDAVGGWSELAARLHDAGLAVATLPDAVAGTR